MATLTHPPGRLGVFAPYRAGALAGVSGRRIGQWARYGLIRPHVYEGRPANRYAFLDVAEAIVVHWLQRRGFKLEEIHSAITEAHREYPEWPLVTAPLGVARHAGVDDRGLIAQEVDGQYIEISRPTGQAVLQPEIFIRAQEVLQKGGWLADELALTRIEVDPEKLGGAPSLRGRRWSIERVAQVAADDEGRELLVEDYGLDEEDIDESVRWTEAAAAL